MYNVHACKTYTKIFGFKDKYKTTWCLKQQIIYDKIYFSAHLTATRHTSAVSPSGVHFTIR